MHTGVARSAHVPATRSDDRGLSFSLLGELTAHSGGLPLGLGGRRQRAVLALLILARGEIVAAGQLADLLWGDAPPPSSSNALQAYVSHLRRRLEPDRTARDRTGLILSRGGGYALRVDDEAVDAWRFERVLRETGPGSEPRAAAAALTEALTWWRGPALADYAGEAWAQAPAARLTELRAVARERLIEARLDCGEGVLLVPEIEGLVAEEPLREDRWRLLVLALYRCNRQADALAALRRARETLADELGVDPGPALRALEADVLTQAPTLDARAAAPWPGAAPRPRAAPASPAASDTGALVDRDRELAALQGCLADALEGQARLALIEGPAGIGKSRLLAEARRVAAGTGALTLTARGSQLESDFAFGAVRQLFEPVLTDPARRTELLGGSAASASAVFESGALAAQPRTDASFGVLHGLYWLTVNLALERPLVLLVDDVQWCDSGALRYLAYVARRLEGLRLLVVAAVRTGEQHQDEALIAELTGDPAAVPIRPGPLSVDGVGDLVRHRLAADADDVFVLACHRTTSGNPLLLRQLLRALETDRIRPDASHVDTVTAIGSRAVSAMVLMRLSRLPAGCGPVAHAVAVLGDGVSLPTVATLAQLPETDVARAIAALVRTEILRNEYPLGFVHPLVRDAVYRDIPAGTLQLQHERAARVLEAAGGSPEQIAAHLILAPHRGQGWVVNVLRQAATRAAERGAADSAVTYLARALAEPPEVEVRPQILMELGRLETFGDGAAALAHLREAYEMLTDPVLRAGTAQMLTRTLIFAGAPGDALEFARRAAADLPEGLVDEQQALLALERVGGYMHELEPSRWQGSARPTIVGEGAGARLLAAEQAWEVLISGVDRSRCVELARFALADLPLVLAADPGLLWVVAAMVRELADDDVGAFWDEALADAHARGSLFAVLSVHLWRGHMLWRRGELVEAQASLRAATEQLDIWGNRVGALYAEAFLTHVYLDQGDVAGARAVLDGAPRRDRFGDGARLFREAEARLLAAEGRPREALLLLERRWTGSGTDNPAWHPWRSLRGQVLAALGEQVAAIELVEQELALARAWGAPTQIGRTLRVLGELRGPVGVGELREAVSLLAPSAARLEHARALAALARSGEVGRDDAVPLLTQALEIAEACRATTLRATCADGLRRAGVTAPPPDAVATLTSTERRVAELSAAGADERGIAQRLFLTPQTVRKTLAELRARQLGADAPGS